MLETVNPLSQYAENITSQWGEDGIIEHICQVLGIEKGWCVEFGAADGKWLSNTHALINKKNWSGVLIERRPDAVKELKGRYTSREDVYCLDVEVSFEGPNRLDAIFVKTPLPKEFDLISIDIDGNDYQVWESLVDYQPKIVIVEYNPSIPNNVHFTQPRDMRVHQGNSLKALVDLGKEKGYELVATTRTNGIFVKKEFFPRFGITNNEIEAMRPASESELYRSQVFQLYDGTFVMQGKKDLVWRNGYRRAKVKLKQIYPWWLRGQNIHKNPKRQLRKWWLSMKCRFKK